MPHLIVVLVFLAAIAFYLTRLKRLRVWDIGERYALPLSNRYDFSFRVVVADKAVAERCASLITLPDLAINIRQAPTGKWVVVGTITMRPVGPRFDEIVDAFYRAAEQCGDPDPGIISEATLRGSGTGLLLANNSFKPKPLRGSA